MEDWHLKYFKLESSLVAIEKEFDGEKSTNSCFSWKTDVFDLLRHLCSFAANWEASHILFLLGTDTSINSKDLLYMVDETNRRWAPSETRPRLAIEKAFNDEKSTNSCFSWNESTIKINWKLVTNASIDWKMGGVMLKRLHVLFELALMSMKNWRWKSLKTESYMMWLKGLTLEISEIQVCFNAVLWKSIEIQIRNHSKGVACSDVLMNWAQ